MKLILDLDTGIDDSLAIAFALGTADIELLAVTCLYGNTTGEQAASNTLSILDLLGREDIPVYLGAQAPLGKSSFQVSDICKRIHGEDGIGDAGVPPSSRTAEKQGAVSFLIESIKKHGKDLTIVPAGPLTNLALALQQAPELKDLLGPVVLMGGAVTVPGNTTPWAEANVHTDPAAAKYVLESGIDITLVGLDVTSKTLLAEKDLDLWRHYNSPAAVKLAEMTSHYFKAYVNQGIQGCRLHDPLAVAVARYPHLVETKAMPLTADAEGPLAGRTTCDMSRINETGHSVKVCLDVKPAEFLPLFMTAVKRAVSHTNGAVIHPSC